MEELQKVVSRNTFGICPRCGKNLFLLNSTYELFSLSESGFASDKIDKHVISKAVCQTPSCGFKMDMVITINGLLPVGFKGELPKPILNPNPIGKEDKSV